MGMGFISDFFRPFTTGFKEGYYDGDSPEEKVFKEKALQGNAEAQFRLAVWWFSTMRAGNEPQDVVVNGINSMRDNGYAWLSIAATNGYFDAQKLIKKIDAQTEISFAGMGSVGLIIPAEQIKEAQGLAKKMIAGNPNLIPAANGSVSSAIISYMGIVNFTKPEQN